MRTRILHASLAVAAFASMGAGECGQIISDSGFDLWCGPSLCEWEVESGEIVRVATWHEGDAGVELRGTDVKLSQLGEVNVWDGACVRFEMIADLAESVDLRLQMDVFGDGTYEYDERIPSSDWRHLSYLVKLPPHQDWTAETPGVVDVRFRLYKRGTGRAVLANIGAEIADDAECTTPPLIVTPPAVAPRPAVRSPLALTF